jgi:hypothetical protein
VKTGLDIGAGRTYFLLGGQFTDLSERPGFQLFKGADHERIDDPWWTV